MKPRVLFWQKMLEPFDKHGRMDVDACMDSFLAVPRSQPPDYEHGLPRLAEPLAGRQTDRRSAPGHRAGIHGTYGLRQPALYRLQA